MSRSKLDPQEKALIAFLERLPRIKVGLDYTKTDQARDFLAVFGTDAGQRVLAQISAFCSPISSQADAEKPGLLAFREGQRWVLGKIMHAFILPGPDPVKEESPDAGTEPTA